MAFASHVFTKFLNQLGTKTVNMATDPFRVILLNGTSYATLAAGLLAIQDTAATVADVKAASGYAEVTTGLGGSNYAQNANSHLSGLAIASPTWTESGHGYVFTSATNPTWTGAGSAFNPGFALFFDDIGGTDATNFAMGWWDFGQAQLGTTGPYSLIIPAGGILTDTGS